MLELPVAGSCEHYSKLFGSFKEGEIEDCWLAGTRRVTLRLALHYRFLFIHQSVTDAVLN